MPSPDDRSLSLARLAAKVAEMAERNPALARALREERAALAIASALAEILEARGQTLEFVADETGIQLTSLEDLINANVNAKPSISTLASIASSLGYQFEFRLYPHEAVIAEGTRLDAHWPDRTAQANIGAIELPDFREVQ